MTRRVIQRDADELAAMLRRERAEDVARAHALAAEGKSLYEIAIAIGRTKEWLRTYAGLN